MESKMTSHCAGTVQTREEKTLKAG